MRFLRFWTRNKTDTATWNRNSDYTITFKRNEELPLDIWTYVVKHRAGFKCEIDSKVHSRVLVSHHIKFTRNEGKNILRNGKALCSLHHGEAHKITFKGPLDNRKFTPKIILRAIGKRKYRALLDEIQNAIDKRQGEI